MRRQGPSPGPWVDGEPPVPYSDRRVTGVTEKTFRSVKRRKAVKGQGEQASEVELEPKESGEFVGQVFKTLSDKFVGTLSFFRVFSGKISTDQALVNARSGKSSRTGGLLIMQGKQQKPVPEAIAGDIVAVAKVEDLAIGDTVATSANAPQLTKPTFPTPMFGLAVRSPRPYFGRTWGPSAPAAATTSRSVVHEPCGSRPTTNDSPFSSIAAGADAEIVVIRTNVSRSYTSWRLRPSIRGSYRPFLANASLTSNRSAKSASASTRTVI